MAQGMVVEGMLHGGKDLGFTIEIYQLDDLFDLRGQTEFGFGEQLHIVMGDVSQGEQGIALLKVSAVRS